MIGNYKIKQRKIHSDYFKGGVLQHCSDCAGWVGECGRGYRGNKLWCKIINFKTTKKSGVVDIPLINVYYLLLLLNVLVFIQVKYFLCLNTKLLSKQLNS